MHDYFMRTLMLKLAVVIGLIVTSIVCARYALADFYYQNAKDHYGFLSASQSITVKHIKPIMADIDDALKLRASHTDALDFKADLLYQLWWLSPDGQYLHQSDHLQKALKLHLRSNDYRINWAYSAARVALIYSHQPNLDEKFEYWFAKSHRIGLYETAIARSLGELGLQHWPFLTDDQRKLTKDYIRVSIEQKANSPMSMALLLSRYKKHKSICFELPSSVRKDQMCAISL